MAIFKIQKKKVSQISLNEQGFGSEFELRDLFADNLEQILGVRFLAKEYPTLVRAQAGEFDEDEQKGLADLL